MPLATIRDCDFYYEMLGEGPPLALVTGLAGLASYWEPNVEELARSFTVLRYDHRGTGRSVRSEQPYSIELLTVDLIDLLDALGIQRASILGHSTGGAIGQVLAATRPERVENLILYGSWATLSPQMRLCMDVRLQLLRALGPEAFHRASPVFLYPPRFVHDEWARIERDLAGAVANSTTASILEARIDAVLQYQGAGYLADIAAPTLVLVAGDDVLTPVVSSEELAAHIPNASLVVLPYGAHAASHCVPGVFNETVVRFLTGQGAGPGDRQSSAV